MSPGARGASAGALDATLGRERPPPSQAARRTVSPSACADRLLALLGADGEAVGGDELGLDADEVEHAAQIGLEMLERGRRASLRRRSRRGRAR